MSKPEANTVPVGAEFAIEPWQALAGVTRGRTTVRCRHIINEILGIVVAFEK
jgi:hypothetical protein